ncbi:glutathione S-transferase family protein [Phytohalomonas tamaricis]|uniref:glutathione S-transferase family protein n=1 Tax=Phytohalomonas tamaricis TaxID=2081032 RepID=UPI000D0B98EC|nr:glutathione S-transferase family protein [Phytohalomonas tamaricis]
MSDFTLYGFDGSTYVRTVRMLFIEKGVPYERVAIDILKGEHLTPEHLRRHPFGKVPALETGGRILYETDAIAEFLEGHFPAPAFFPRNLDDRVDMRQWAAVINNYIYPSMIGKLVWQRIINPFLGRPVDDAVAEQALPEIRHQFELLEKVLSMRPHLVAGPASYVDLLLAPIMAYMAMTEEGQQLLSEFPGVNTWWEKMSRLDSFQRTAPQL